MWTNGDMSTAVLYQKLTLDHEAILTLEMIFVPFHLINNNYYNKEVTAGIK